MVIRVSFYYLCSGEVLSRDLLMQALKIRVFESDVNLEVLCIFDLTSSQDVGFWFVLESEQMSGESWSGRTAMPQFCTMNINDNDKIQRVTSKS